MNDPFAACTPAIWYGASPVAKDGSGVGLFLKSDDGHIHRFRLPIKSAVVLVDAINDSLRTYWRMNSHSDSSIGSPTVDVSSPVDGGNVWPPIRSSSAASGE
jgi:hypothetical protein